MLVDDRGALHDDRGQYAGNTHPAPAFDLTPTHPETVTDVASLDGPPTDVTDTSRAQAQVDAIVAARFDRDAVRAAVPKLSDADFEDVWEYGTDGTYPLRTLTAAEHTLRHGIVDRATLESVGLDVHDDRVDRFGDLVPALAEADLEARLDEQGRTLAENLVALEATAPAAPPPWPERAAQWREDAQRAVADTQAALDDEPSVAQIAALDEALGRADAATYATALLSSPGVFTGFDPHAPHRLPVPATRALYTTLHTHGDDPLPSEPTPDDRDHAISHLRARSLLKAREAAALAAADRENRAVARIEGEALGLAAAANWLAADS